MNSNPVRQAAGLIISLIILSVPIFSREDLRTAGTDQDNWQSIAAFITDTISVELNDITFGEALEIIAGKGGFKLSYNRSRLPLDQTVASIRTSAPAFEVLFVLLQQTGTTLILTSDSELAIVPSVNSINNGATISGQVVDAGTNEPLIGTNISIPGSALGGTSDLEGQFVLSSVSKGFQIVQFQYIGYKTLKVVTYINGDELQPLTVEMESETLLLNEIIVTPGLFAIMGKGPTMRQTLTHEDMQNITFGEDVYRALKRLPGVTANDFSAKFTVRGSENEEVLVLLDGMEIYEPFHLKDITGGAFSFIDVGVIESANLLTGGFPAEYGNRMGAVLEMNSIRPTIGKQRTSLGLSMMNAMYRTEGTLAGDRGVWFLSARRGFLDVLLNMVAEGDDEIPRPVYYDIHAKVAFQTDRNHQNSLHFLHARDNADYWENENIGPGVRKIGSTAFGNTYAWFNSSAKLLPDLFSKTVLSLGSLSRRRESEFPGASEPGTLLDKKSAYVLGLRQIFNYQYSDAMLFKGGINLKYHQAKYDFNLDLTDEVEITRDSVEIREKRIHTFLKPNGFSGSVFISHRYKILDPLVVEAGLRFDAIDYTQSSQLSPRLNLVWILAEQTFLRAGWGHFYQDDAIHEIKVEDGEDAFRSPEIARHWIAGFEHTYNNGLNIRLEGYVKKMSQLHPNYLNGTNHVQFPELEDDRYQLNINSALYRGIELYLKYDQGGRFTWWATYAIANFSENVKNVVFRDSVYTQGFTTHPNVYDQRHTFYLDLNYRTATHWYVNLAGQFHSGLPYFDLGEFLEITTDGTVVLGDDFSQYNRDNYDPYSRVDIRINREFRTSKGTFTAYLQVINLFNKKNLRTIEFDDYIDYYGETQIVETAEYWFPRLPLIGITWEWDQY
ncbi:MAG: TonB-dependent receptor [Candidatus Neomarinimicrobiota bacterium]